MAARKIEPVFELMASIPNRPQAMAVDRQGDVWMTVNQGSGTTPVIAEVTAAGQHHSWSLHPPRNGGIGYFSRITTGADGTVWFFFSNPTGCPVVGYISPGGKPAEVSGCVPTGGVIAGGANGQMWFWMVGSQAYYNELGSVSKSGTVEQHRLPQGNGLGGGDLAPGHGDLWVSDLDYIVKLTYHDKWTLFPIAGKNPSDRYYPAELVQTKIGMCVFEQQDRGRDDLSRLALVDGSGTMHTYPVPARHSVEDLSAGPSETAWFVDGYGADSIGRLTAGGTYVFYQLYGNVNDISLMAGGPKSTLYVAGDYNDETVVGRIAFSALR